MTALEIMARFQPLMPEGVRFAASFPIAPVQNEKGEWIQPAADALVVRVATRKHLVDAICTEADLAWTDAMFQERILKPMLAMLEHVRLSDSEAA